MRLADRILYKITARNWLGWPTERLHRLTGKVQHIRYNETGRWADGPLPKEGELHGHD